VRAGVFEGAGESVFGRSVKEIGNGEDENAQQEIGNHRHEFDTQALELDDLHFLENIRKPLPAGGENSDTENGNRHADGAHIKTRFFSHDGSLSDGGAPQSPRGRLD
jgi:hypothetical protein